MAPITEEEAAWDLEMDRLWRLNLFAAYLHFVSGVGGIRMLFYFAKIRDFKVPLTTMFLKWESVPLQELIVKWNSPFVESDPFQ